MILRYEPALNHLLQGRYFCSTMYHV